MATASSDVKSVPTTGGIIGAAAFWVVAIAIAALTVWWAAPAYVWVLRILSIVAGVGVAVGLIIRENSRESHGLPVDRDSTAFDLWTIAHFLAGVVMGAWGIPFVLVAVYTIAWEIFEWQVPGFGDAEIFTNRLVDIAVAWIGWLLLALVVTAGTSQGLPWLVPMTGSILHP